MLPCVKCDQLSPEMLLWKDRMLDVLKRVVPLEFRIESVHYTDADDIPFVWSIIASDDTTIGVDFYIEGKEAPRSEDEWFGVMHAQQSQAFNVDLRAVLHRYVHFIPANASALNDKWTRQVQDVCVVMKQAIRYKRAHEDAQVDVQDVARLFE